MEDTLGTVFVLAPLEEDERLEFLVIILYKPLSLVAHFLDLLDELSLVPNSTSKQLHGGLLQCYMVQMVYPHKYSHIMLQGVAIQYYNVLPHNGARCSHNIFGRCVQTMFLGCKHTMSEGVAKQCFRV